MSQTWRIRLGSAGYFDSLRNLALSNIPAALGQSGAVEGEKVELVHGEYLYHKQRVIFTLIFAIAFH